MNIEIAGFAPEEEVTLEVHSDPVVLGKVKADTKGTAHFTWDIPADFPVGAHTLHAIGASKRAEHAFTMAAKPSQPQKDPKKNSTPGDSKPGGKTPAPSGKVVPQKNHLARTGAGLRWNARRHERPRMPRSFGAPQAQASISGPQKLLLTSDGMLFRCSERL